MNYQEKRETVKSMDEDFAFLLSYDDAETAARDVVDSYKHLISFFDFEVEDLEKFEEEIRYFIDDEFYRCPMEPRYPSPDGLAS